MCQRFVPFAVCVSFSPKGKLAVRFQSSSWRMQCD
jgi:hypothetical protein